MEILVPFGWVIAHITAQQWENCSVVPFDLPIGLRVIGAGESVFNTRHHEDLTEEFRAKRLAVICEHSLGGSIPKLPVFLERSQNRVRIDSSERHRLCQNLLTVSNYQEESPSDLRLGEWPQDVETDRDERISSGGNLLGFLVYGIPVSYLRKVRSS